ncbi:MAG TPA: hypothetical protein VFZ61_24850 [Polyangiales bacterium]
MLRAEVTPQRLVKGTNLVDLIKLLRGVRKVRKLDGLSGAADQLLADRILPTAWYAHETFVELLDFTFRALLNGSEKAACEMGATGGRAELSRSMRALVDRQDPLGSVLAMRHAWQASFNFGMLRAGVEERSVVFRLSGYRDVGTAHAHMIAGFGLAAAQLSGAPQATAEVLEAPWRGATELVYRIQV